MAVGAACGGGSSDAGDARAGDAGEPIRWFIASSVAPVADELIDRFAAASTREIRTNLGSSSVLARQITHGAIADVWISADSAWVEYVARETGLAIHAAPWATNHVVWVRDVATAGGWPPPLEPSTRIAIGDPDHVPVGRYARAWLGDHWDSFRPHFVYAPHARAVLAFVETGAAGYGAVYHTDARTSTRVRVVEAAGRSAPTTYWLVTHPSAGADARAFATFLRSAGVDSILALAGFGRPVGVDS
jgi:molybdate transport system substrate-binding protein